MKQLTLSILLCMIGLVSFAQSTTPPNEPKVRKTYYVKSEATGRGDGTTWEDSSGSLHDMLDKASKGDTIFVAEGKYTGAYIMKPGVSVFGGFSKDANSNTTNFERRVPPGMGQNLTYLDGEYLVRPLSQYEAIEDTTIHTLWEGFIIENGLTGINEGTIITDYKGLAAGIVYHYDEDTKLGKVMSLSESAGEWGAYDVDVEGIPNMLTEADAKADMDGKVYTDTLFLALGKGSSAVSRAAYHGKGGFTDWYLPACGELNEVYEKKDTLNQIMTQLGNDTLLSGVYWSSSEYDESFAWRIGFKDGLLHQDTKLVEQFKVRPVRMFRAANNFNSTTTCGGGVHLLKGGKIRNCIIQHNVATFRGGGVFAGEGSEVIGCLLTNNLAAEAAGAYVMDGRLVNTTVADNAIYRSIFIDKVPQVGDIYFSDGTYSKNVDYQKTPIGLVVSTDPMNPYSGRIMHIGAVDNVTWWELPAKLATLNTYGFNDWTLGYQQDLKNVAKELKDPESAMSKILPFVGMEAGIDYEAKYWLRGVHIGNKGAYGDTEKDFLDLKTMKVREAKDLETQSENNWNKCNIKLFRSF